MRGLGLIVYGPPGIGKTTIATHFPKPMTFLSIKENGFEELDEAGIIEVEGIEHYQVHDYKSLIAFLKESKGQKTVVLDSLSGLQQIFFDWCIDEFYDGSSSKFFSYAEGPRRTAPQQFIEFESLITNLNTSGTHIVLLGHSKVTNIDNPLGDNYSQSVLDLDEGIRSILTKWARAILFYDLDMTIKKGGKAEETSDRIIYTQKSPGHMAKNRLNLKPYITCGENSQDAYDNFVKALPPKIKEFLNG